MKRSLFIILGTWCFAIAGKAQTLFPYTTLFR